MQETIVNVDEQRQEIDRIDREILRLVRERALARDVLTKARREQGLPAHSATDEHKKIQMFGAEIGSEAPILAEILRKVQPE